MHFARARTHVRALMTRKSCAVGMRNAILRNYLKLHLEYNVYACSFIVSTVCIAFFKLHKPRNSGIPLVYGEMDLLLGGHIHVLSIGDGNSYRGVSKKKR